MKISGAAAIVTGGGSGLGRATAEALAAKGARVAVADLNAAAAEEAGLILNARRDGDRVAATNSQRRADRLHESRAGLRGGIMDGIHQALEVALQGFHLGRLSGVNGHRIVGDRECRRLDFPGDFAQSGQVTLVAQCFTPFGQVIELFEFRPLHGMIAAAGETDA